MSRLPLPDLPVGEALGPLAAALGAGGAAVLVAPPGAGKTTIVPLALLDAGWLGGRRIVLLEPRRLAARAAARRMAALLGEEVGGTVGYAMRMDRRISDRTRILVVTEGVFARMAVDDPELSGIGAVLFDEAHERSLDGDFGLALALDIRGGLRPDLRVLVMSATIDGARLAALIGDAPLIQSQGKAFPVEIRHRDRVAGIAIEDAVAAAIRDALAAEAGSILAFLPGQREIGRVAERLEGRLAADVDIFQLHGGLEGAAQDRAIRPAEIGRRKVVLATAIAETSITIDGVRVVVDSGLSRVPKYEPDTGVTRLETVRLSRASAEQRAGRAGRTAPGVAIRLWGAGQTAALQPFSTPEILEADLAGLVLDCAAFGVADPATLSFLDSPPAPALAEARALLAGLGAVDAAGRMTQTGAAMRKLALPVRFAHMVALATARGEGLAAAELAVLLTERGLGGLSPDLDRRLDAFRAERGDRAASARSLARGIASQAGGKGELRPPAGRLLLDAWPDRVAKARGEPGRYLLANGRGAMLDAVERLAAEPFLVVADLQGKAQNARITAAAAIEESDLRERLGGRVTQTVETRFDAERGAIRRVAVERIGAIVLTESNLPAPSGAEADVALLDAVRGHGLSILPWDKEATTLRHRLDWLHRGLGDPWPAMDDNALIARLEDWLAPFLAGQARPDRIAPAALRSGLMALAPHDLARRVDQLAPTHFSAPTGSHVPIRYDGETPVLAIRVQELFGLGAHPAIAGGTVPLTLELLSPAHRPIQTTRDLPGFWRGSWADVRADMRGRYPRHVWPENPLEAQATSRAKPRGT
ncbi:MAG: ATP-dependent helicase HrpB [Phyllobacteriaceae bacterium]|nr:ATP-dependent helicase HrpB [Phyllobacteriaceae bacterium]